MSTEKTDPREAKLPKWAQEELVRLRDKLAHEVAYWKGKAYEATGPEPSDILVDYRHDSTPRFLPSDSRVRFTLDADPNFFPQRRRSVEAMIKDGELQLYAGEGKLIVMPVASNVIGVRVVR